MPQAAKEIIYIADPMCSWCWGFSPVLRAMLDEYGDQVPFSLMVGGLRPGSEEPMGEDVKNTLIHHWEEVNKTTGQEFCFDFRFPAGFVYDTDPSCRAAVTVRDLKPGATFPYFDALHRAFYVENRDLTDPAILSALAEPFGIAPDAFLEHFNAKDTRRAAFLDFATAFNLGIQGFPAVVLKEGEEYTLLTVGYQPFDVLKPQVDAWLDAG